MPGWPAVDPNRRRDVALPPRAARRGESVKNSKVRPEPKVERVAVRNDSDAEKEDSLIAAIEAADRVSVDRVFDLVKFYQNTGRPLEAVAWLEPLTGHHIPSARDLAWLVLGNMAEQAGDFAKAVAYYERGLQEEPRKRLVLYFMHNNLGYSLSKVGEYQRAEEHCRAAIAVSNDRYNAHKNLGIALEGQGYWFAAALAYVDAVTADDCDARPLIHLENLIAAHPEVEKLLPRFTSLMESCRRLEQLRLKRFH